jgi:hypothetical protein
MDHTKDLLINRYMYISSSLLKDRQKGNKPTKDNMKKTAKEKKQSRFICLF